MIEYQTALTSREFFEALELEFCIIVMFRCRQKPGAPKALSPATAYCSNTEQFGISHALVSDQSMYPISVGINGIVDEKLSGQLGSW